ncbi:MAG: DUF190 domain-containing protein [Actinomycetota bacterium]|nr:DUF190 domain-containing protein [Actinomycetota bacterium]
MTDLHSGGYQRLTVMLQTRDHSHHHSLATELLSRARKAHLAGATLLAGVEGEGRSGVRHHQHLFYDDAPLSLVIVDDRESLARFILECQELLGDAVVVLDDVDAFRA